MANCKIAEAIKRIEDAYKEVPSTAENKRKKAALLDLYSKVSIDRAEIRQKGALLKVDPYPQQGPSILDESPTPEALVDTESVKPATEDALVAEDYNFTAPIVRLVEQRKAVKVAMSKQLAFNIILNPKETYLAWYEYSNGKDSIEFPDFDALLKDKGRITLLSKELNISPQEVEERIKMFQAKEDMRIVKAHEYIHAGTMQFMKENPNDAKTTYVNNLFSKLKRQAEKNSASALNNIQGGYWKKNIDEFIAVALSNPQMIAYLNRQKATGFVSIFHKFVNTIAKMLNLDMGSESAALYNIFARMVENMPDENQPPWSTINTDEQIQANPEVQYRNHSGGANGADTEWGRLGKVYGVTSKHYYYGTRTPSGTDHISQSDYEVGRYKAAEAAKAMFGYKYKTMKSPLLIRNWSQVKYADAVFAISEIVNKGQQISKKKDETRIALKQVVLGGTGYAVEMAIQAGKPVYVFDQKQNSWFVWNTNNNQFVETGTPVLTPNFAGIGTRQLGKNGKKAIKDVYEKTFNLTEKADETIQETPNSVSEQNSSYKISGDLKTNASQTSAIDRMKSWYSDTAQDTFLLQGRGGTGKTTVINVLLRELGIPAEDVIFATPTNKATKVIKNANKNSAYSGSRYYTIAQLLGLKPVIDNDGNQTFEQDTFAELPSLGRVIVIDEASMIRSEDYERLLARAAGVGAKVIFMGDNAQLPPINDKKARIKATVFDDNSDSTTRLTELMRQAEDSPIIDFTDSLIEQVNEVESRLENKESSEDIKSRLRSVIWDGLKFNRYNSKTHEGVLLTSEVFQEILPSFLQDFRRSPESTKYIFYNRHDNERTLAYVAAIRRELYGERASQEAFIQGEPLMLNGPYLYNVRNASTDAGPSLADNGEEFTVVSSERVQKKLEYLIGKQVVTTVAEADIYEIKAKNRVDGELITFYKPANKAEYNAIVDREVERWSKERAPNGKINRKRGFMVRSVLASALSHGYIINSHRAQGSTYDNVYMDLGNISGQTAADANSIIKSLYVAASRPRKKLVVIDNRNNAGNQITNSTRVRQIDEAPSVQTQNKGEQADVLEKIGKCSS